MHVIWAPIKTYNIYNVPIFDISVGLFYINVPAISENKNKNTLNPMKWAIGYTML